MTFKEIKDIDTLMECVPLVDDIISDTALLESCKEMSWMEAAAPIYKAHTESLDKLIQILDEHPENAMGTLTAVTKVLVSLFMDEKTKAFFLLSCKNVRQQISATENTEGEQSAVS